MDQGCGEPIEWMERQPIGMQGRRERNSKQYHLLPIERCGHREKRRKKRRMRRRRRW